MDDWVNFFVKMSYDTKNLLTQEYNSQLFSFANLQSQQFIKETKKEGKIQNYDYNIIFCQKFSIGIQFQPQLLLLNPGLVL